MAEKQIRAQPMPDGIAPPMEVEGQEVPVEMLESFGPRAVEELPQTTDQEDRQVDMLLGSILDFVWDEGYDEVKSRLESGRTNLEQTIGDLAGQMVNREVQAASGAGVEVSRDILLGVGAEVINAISEIAVKEGILDAGSDAQQDEFQGEALIYATQKYGELGDPVLESPEGQQRTIENAMNILREKPGFTNDNRSARKLGMREPTVMEA